MPTDLEKLDAAKRKFLEAKEEIEGLREAIAAATCPLKIGETITVVEDGKEYQGLIDHIGPASPREEMLGPVVGAPAGWAAGGQRINKTSGQTGKWSFGINSFEATLTGGKWIVEKQRLEDILGIGPSNPA